MNRTPSPHPIKLASIPEDFETTTYTNACTQCNLKKILKEIKEIKNILKKLTNN